MEEKHFLLSEQDALINDGGLESLDNSSRELDILSPEVPFKPLSYHVAKKNSYDGSGQGSQRSILKVSSCPAPPPLPLRNLHAENDIPVNKRDSVYSNLERMSA